MRRQWTVFACILLAGLAVRFDAQAQVVPAPVFVSLHDYVNNVGITQHANEAGGNFDGRRDSYPADALPNGIATLDNVPYDFPAAKAGTPDNILADGQRVAMPAGRFVRAYLLGTGVETFRGAITVNYAGGRHDAYPIAPFAWDSPWSGVVNVKRVNGAHRAEEIYGAHIFAYPIFIDDRRKVVSIGLPALPTDRRSSFHVFAITLFPALPQVSGYAVDVLSARSTTRQRATQHGRAQLIEATIANTGSRWYTPQHAVSVRVDVPGATTLEPARITHLAPGDRTIVEIPILTGNHVAPGTTAHADVVATLDGASDSAQGVTLTLGVPPYTANPASLSMHEAPEWFDNGKFGIFIHWGVYSVPAWAPVGTYAEWYWHSLHEKQSPTYRHQLAEYGPASRYDDFIPQFTAARFDPKAWVDLFHDAGARYFVLTSKHHEGFALYDTKTTDRNAVKMGPHRNLVAELFAASRKYQPELHRGLYYSLYEWYNPAYTGHAVRQFASGAAISYAGYRPVKDYVNDQMLPQMHEIIDEFSPEIIWCDGEWEKPPAYWHDAATIAYYYNKALARNQGVAIDDRCRVDGTRDSQQTVYDFSTPEYATYSTLVTKKWEASRGMGFSYGYNANERPGDYKSAAELVGMLVDMVSKNGNLLLDIGPRPDGTIPEIMQQRLRAMGAWLHTNGEAIYDTTYWWETQEDGNLRFTVRPNEAFYVISLVKPTRQLVVHAPIPIAPGDRVTMLGYAGAPLAWRTNSAGDVVIDVPKAAADAGRYAWAFKIAW